MIETHVVTCFLESQSKILLLKRSADVGSYAGKWAGISGYIENGHTSLEQAFIEIHEEIGLNKEQIELVKIGNTLEIIDEQLQKKWVVHPFRFIIETPKNISLDWEHTEFKWIAPDEISQFSTVPGLSTAWERVS